MEIDFFWYLLCCDCCLSDDVSRLVMCACAVNEQVMSKN